MAGYENVTIIGNVGRDPELKYLQSGIPVCSFSVAVNKKWKDKNDEQKEKTTWFKVTAWRQLAEVCNQYVHKGMQVMAVGTVEASAYIGKDGQPAASLELTADKVIFLGGGRDENSGDRSETHESWLEEITDIPF